MLSNKCKEMPLKKEWEENIEAQGIVSLEKFGKIEICITKEERTEIFNNGEYSWISMSDDEIYDSYETKKYFIVIVFIENFNTIDYTAYIYHKRTGKLDRLYQYGVDYIECKPSVLLGMLEKL